MTMRFDAQDALRFLVAQASYIESEVYKIQYPDIRYTKLVPIDTSASEWAPSVTFYSVDGVGRAQWYNAGAQDLPHAELIRSKYETQIRMAGAAYSYDLAELGQAQLLNINLTSDKAELVRRVSEEFIDNVALFGDTGVGFTGLLNNTGVTTVTAAATGTAAGTTFASKLGTPTLILADVNSAILAPYIASNTIEVADTLLLPLTQWATLASTPMSNVQPGLTILQYLMQSNVYTARTGLPLTIEGVIGLDTAGAGATARMVAYRKAPQVVKMHMPMPLKFLPPWQVGPAKWEVPAIFRIGGVDIRRPAAFRYVDGI
jgi:hypothetical protein